MDDEDDADTGHSADSAGLVDGAREAAQHAQQQRRPPPPMPGGHTSAMVQARALPPIPVGRLTESYCIDQILSVSGAQLAAVLPVGPPTGGLPVARGPGDELPVTQGLPGLPPAPQPAALQPAATSKHSTLASPWSNISTHPLGSPCKLHRPCRLKNSPLTPWTTRTIVKLFLLEGSSPTLTMTPSMSLTTWPPNGLVRRPGPRQTRPTRMTPTPRRTQLAGTASSTTPRRLSREQVRRKNSSILLCSTPGHRAQCCRMA